VEDASADTKAAERPAAAAHVGTAASTAAVAADGARTNTDDNTVAVIAAAASDDSSSGEENAITRGTRTATSGKAATWRIVRNRWADFVDESAEEAEKSDMTEGFNESKTVSLKKLSGALPSTNAENVKAMSAVQTLGKNAAAKRGNVTEEKKECKTERLKEIVGGAPSTDATEVKTEPAVQTSGKNDPTEKGDMTVYMSNCKTEGEKKDRAETPSTDAKDGKTEDAVQTSGKNGHSEEGDKSDKTESKKESKTVSLQEISGGTPSTDARTATLCGTMPKVESDETKTGDDFDDDGFVRTKPKMKRNKAERRKWAVELQELQAQRDLRRPGWREDLKDTIVLEADVTRGNLDASCEAWPRLGVFVKLGPRGIKYRDLNF
jgi:hypothetical protein